MKSIGFNKNKYFSINDVNQLVVIQMAKKDKQVLPPSGAGLVRYFEEETKGPKLSPEQVVIMTVVLAVFCIALRFTYS